MEGGVKKLSIKLSFNHEIFNNWKWSSWNRSKFNN